MALEVPIFIVVSKLDLVTPIGLEKTIIQLTNLIKGPGFKRIPMVILTEDDAISAAASFKAEQ